MDEIISLVVANGLWAALFCGLLVFELRDSRARENKYTGTIRTLSERLCVLTAVKAETFEIKADTDKLLNDAAEIKRIVGKSKAVKKSGRAVTRCNPT